MNRVPRPDRESADIIHDLLALANKAPVMKTHLMYKANLNSKQIGDYIEILLRHKLINESVDRYRTTTKGTVYLEIYDQLQELLK